MKFNIYVDGSYYTQDPSKVYGAFVLLKEDQPILAIRYESEDKSAVSMRNVGGELLASKGAIISAAQIINTQCDRDIVHDVKIYYDYKGVFEFVNPVRPWKTNNAATTAYARVINKIQKDTLNMRLSFEKVKAHTGDRWNEVVDNLAKGYVSSEIENCYKGTFKI